MHGDGHGPAEEPHPADEVDEERELHRAELAACRHALAEYDIVTYLVTAGDDLGEILGQRTRVRA